MDARRVVLRCFVVVVVIAAAAAYFSRTEPVRGIDLVPRAYVGVWNEADSGDVAPRWTIAKGYLYMPRGLTLDPKKKTEIISDKYKNSVMTFSLPELYNQPAVQRETARAAD